MSIIQLTDVSKAFRRNPVLEHVTLSFEEGRTYGIAGPNGSGKSVLFKLICGFLRPDAGSVSIDARYLPKGRSFPREFGVLIDRPGYLAGESGLGNLLALARIQNLIAQDEVEATMLRYGLDPGLREPVRHYSLGMKQKLALCQAVMEKPRVLLLDEPFNALDAETSATLKRELSAFRKSGGTVLFTSHSAEDLDGLSDVQFEVIEHTLRLRAGS